MSVGDSVCVLIAWVFDLERAEIECYVSQGDVILLLFDVLECCFDRDFNCLSYCF